jgi:hypothetical protein
MRLSNLSFDSQDIAYGLWLIYVVALWILRRRHERLILEGFERRDPACWEEDMDRLEALSEAEGIGWIKFLFYLAGLMFSGRLIGIALSADLMLFLAP